MDFKDIELDFASPKFEALYSNEYRIIVLHSGRGTGKSFEVATSIIYHTHEYECRVFCARTIQNSLAQSSWKIIKDTAIRLGLYEDYEFIESKSLIRCKVNNSEIYFGGIDSDPQKFKSYEGIDIFWYEEAQTASQEALDIILPTIRKNKSLLIFTLNPRFETDPISKMFLTSDVNRDDTIIVKLNPEDNKYFPDVLKTEMEYCKRTDFESYKHIWLGEFASCSSESLIPMDSIRVCIGLPMEPQPYLRFAGLDVGATGDPTAMYIREGRRFIALQEWNEPDHHKLKDLVIEFANRHQVSTIIPDATGFGYTFAQMLSSSFGESRVIPVNFAQSATRQGFANKRAEMAMSVREAVMSGIQLPNNNDIIEELSSVRAWRTSSDKWQLESKKDIRSRLGRSTNWLDAIMLSYAIPDIPKSMVNNELQSFNSRVIMSSMWSN